MNRLGAILLNPFFVGLVVSLIVIYFLPTNFHKYQSDFISREYEFESQVYFQDLDNDLYSEKIWFHYDGNNKPGDKAYNVPAIQIDDNCSAVKPNKVIDQFNITKQFPKNQKLFFGDFDNDDFKEIYFYGLRNDSLFLTGLDPLKRKRFFLNKFLAKFNIFNKMPDLVYGHKIFLYDLNDDGNKEIIGSINGAYSASPRFVFAVDLVHDTIYKSVTDGMYISPGSIKKHPDYKNIVVCGGYAPGNVSNVDDTSFLYHDRSSWFLLLNSTLEMIFPPVENEGFTSSVHSFLATEGEELFVYVLFKPPKGNSITSLRKYSIEGQLIDSITILHNEVALIEINDKSGGKLYINKNRKEFYQVNKELNLKNIANVEFKNSFFTDLDNDKDEEIFNWESGHHDALIYRNDFKHPCPVIISDLGQSLSISPTNFKDNSSSFAIHTNHYTSYYSYEFNKLYYLKFPVYGLIYLSISAIFYFMFYFQKKSIKKKYEQEKKMNELELLTIKNQMDPHFTFNVINTASYMIYNKDKKTAYQFLVNFSNLIRNVLQKSKDISIKLSDEIEFVKNYLVLQQHRHDFSFEYELILKGNIDQNTPVPKMIIQTFVENAIKHGLAFRKSNGKLNISISKDTSNLIITVEDNGIGRKASKEIASNQKISTGKGHDIINQVVDLFNKLYKTEVSYTIVDLYDNKNANGTRVEVIIPIRQK